jgi:polyhydroxyalkanoate synthesis regulator phasin
MSSKDPMSHLERLKRLEELEREVKLRDGLPHLFAFKDYQWSYEFKHTRAKEAFILAPNQVGKSTSQIIKMITWATETQLWPELWKGRRPYKFWYLYPSLVVAQSELFSKIIPEYLPRGEFKESGKYSWELYKIKSETRGIRFKESGVIWEFLSYEQGGRLLQTATVDYIAFDEELPEELWGELHMRRSSAGLDGGYISGVMTNTEVNGIDLWWRTFERVGQPDEAFPNAFKRQVSLYDCMHYVDGSPTRYSKERIQQIKEQCGSEIDVQRRVMGRYVISNSNLLFPSYSEDLNYRRNPGKVEENSIYFAGLDWGAGGEAHPSSVVICAVNPDYTRVRVVKCWRGDGVRTTAGDLLEKYLELKGSLPVVAAYYDYSCADLGQIAASQGVPVQKANKSRETGVPLVDTLLKYGALTIDHSDEAEKLNKELKTVKKTAKKTKAEDDLSDALRYALSKLPFQMDRIKSMVEQYEPKVMRNDTPVSKRTQLGAVLPTFDEDSLADEIDGWNELLEI